MTLEAKFTQILTILTSLLVWGVVITLDALQGTFGGVFSTLYVVGSLIVAFLVVYNVLKSVNHKEKVA